MYFRRFVFIMNYYFRKNTFLAKLLYSFIVFVYLRFQKSSAINIINNNFFFRFLNSVCYKEVKLVRFIFWLVYILRLFSCCTLKNAGFPSNSTFI